jgi:hypothetical protein
MSHALAVLSPAPTEEEAEWVSELVWVFWRRETSLGTAGNLTPHCESLHYLHYPDSDVIRHFSNKIYTFLK